jgi:hypothetical protein
MPSILGVGLTAWLAAVFFTCIGWPIARSVFPPGLAAGAAPTLGWAVFSVVALAVFSVLPFSPALSLGFATLWLCAIAAWQYWRPMRGDTAAGLPPWAYALAACLAMLPALAILPKFSHGGVLLGEPIFDHAKIAIIDQMTRAGVPPQNPFFGPAGAPPGLAYYYLWHFSAAVPAQILHVTGWTADAAMTWFSAYGSCLLMMGLALHLGGPATRHVLWLVPLLSLPGSLRPVLDWVSGVPDMPSPRADLGAWLNQSSWVPQHLASGSCVVIAVLLLPRMTGGRGWRQAALLGLVVAAGFESSAWVGGVAFAVAALVTAALLLACLKGDERWRLVIRSACAAGLTLVLIAAFLIQQAQDLAAKNAGAPVDLTPYQAFGAVFSPWIGPSVDLLAFVPLVLPLNFPALFPAGAYGLLIAWRNRQVPADRLDELALGGCVLGTLAVTWLCRSTLENNDLGWRAVIPAILILTPGAALAWARLWVMGPRGILAAALAFALLGVPQTVQKLDLALRGQRPGEPRRFAQSVDMWAALRRFTGPTERVANNPLYVSDETFFPDNIAWALLSDRPSCYAGYATVIAYGGISREAVLEARDLFRRVFDGAPRSGDIEAMAGHFGCVAILVTPQDGAWAHDPFLAAPEYKLVDSMPDRWRIFRRVQASPHVTGPGP